MLLAFRLVSRNPRNVFRCTSTRSYFDIKELKRDEGKPDYKYTPAEKNIRILEGKELQEVHTKTKQFCVKGQILPQPEIYDEKEKRDEFKELIKDPMMAHVADIVSFEHKATKAKQFNTFKHRTKVSIISQMGGRHEDESYYQHVEPHPMASLDILDKVEFIDPVEDVTVPQHKIRANLYDNKNIEIVEDETATYSPELTDDYNKSNYFFAFGNDDPVLKEKLEYAERKRKLILQYPGADDTKEALRLQMWSKHLLDKDMLDKIVEDETPKNLIGKENVEKPDLSPKASYDHYEDIVNDLLAKLLPEEGFLRLDPAWKWNVLETSTHFLKCNPLYIEPTSQFHFPDGLMVMRVAKFLKVRDTYIDPLTAMEEYQRLDTRSWILRKYYGDEDTPIDQLRMKYLRDGALERFLFVNLRYGTFSVATYNEKVDPSPEQWNLQIERAKNKFLSNAQIYEKTKYDSDYADMMVYQLPAEWIVALRKTKFPVFAGTGLTAPERYLHARMHTLGRMQRDDSTMRADISEFAQNLPYRMESNHPFIEHVHEGKYYESYPAHQH